MIEEWKLDDLRGRAEEIRGSVMPKSVTPEMVGGTLSGIVDVLARVPGAMLSEARRSGGVLPFGGFVKGVACAEGEAPEEEREPGCAVYDTECGCFLLARRQGESEEDGTDSGAVGGVTVAPGVTPDYGAGDAPETMLTDGTYVYYRSWRDSEDYGTGTDGGIRPNRKKLYVLVVDGEAPTFWWHDGEKLRDISEAEAALRDDLETIMHQRVNAVWSAIADKQHQLTSSEDVLLNETQDGEGNVTQSQLFVTEKAKRRVFDDMWVQYGEIDSENAPDATHIYLCNEVYMTYAEAQICLPYLVSGTKPYHLVAEYGRCRARTITVRSSSPTFDRQANFNNIVSSSPDLETVRVLPTTANGAIMVANLYFSFAFCPNLRKIIGRIDLTNCNNTGGTFDGDSALEEFDIINLDRSLGLGSSPKLKLSTVSSLLANAKTGAKTVTVHPDIYAKLTDPEQTDWYALLDVAAAKNTSIASA